MNKNHPNQMDLFHMSEEMGQPKKTLKKNKKDKIETVDDLEESNKEKVELQNFTQEEIAEPIEEPLIRGQWTKEEWESPVVEGGPTRQEVEEWKDKYGSVYFTPFEGEIFIWRTLSRPEYREIIRNTELNMLDREEIITDKCVLFPRNYSCQTYTQKGRAGVPSLLSEMIMDKSGFVAQSAPIKL